MAAPEDPDLTQAEERQLREIQARLDRHVQRVATTASARARETTPRRGMKSGHLIAARYRLQSALGAGGSGEVWIAFDEQLERSVAIKVLFDSASTLSPDERLDRERKALARVSHPGIVEIQEASTDGEVRYLVMRLVDGQTIRDVIEAIVGRCASQRAPTTEDLANALGTAGPGQRDLLDPKSLDPKSYARSIARIGTEILRSLEAAHDRKVVHRDLKPENIVLTPGGAPVLLDFGLAADLLREGGALTEEGLAGTPGHLTPEQLKTHRTGNQPAIDIFQVGTILYELLTLVRPFERGLERSEEAKHANAVASHVPVELGDICAFAMSEARYTSARAFRDDLERFLLGRNVPLAAIERRDRRRVRATYAWTRWRPWLLGGAAAAIIAVLTFALLSSRAPTFEWDLVDSGRTLRLKIWTPEAATIFAMLETPGSEANERSYTPLRADSGFGVPTKGGETTLSIPVPSDLAGSPTQLSLQYATDRAHADGFRRLFRDMTNWIRAESSDGVPESTARTIARRLQGSTRSANAPIELSPMQLFHDTECFGSNSGRLRAKPSSDTE